MAKNRLVAANLSLEVRSNGRVIRDWMNRSGNRVAVGIAALERDNQCCSAYSVYLGVLQWQIRMPCLQVLMAVVLH